MQALDVLANNLANSSSRGYKADREINSLYAPVSQQQPWIHETWTDFQQGVLEPTGNQFDIALSGPGFLTMRGPSGNLYTRNGSLHLAANGELQGPENRPVLDRNNNQPIRLDPSRPFTIGRTGEIRQDDALVAQMAVVEFASPSSLIKTGQSYFQNPPSAGNPVRAAETEVRQGVVEASNSGPSEAAVRLVSVLRQFEMLQKAIAIGGEMNRKALDEVARVSS
jgi:flagellar basal body rod protein FlgG